MTDPDPLLTRIATLEGGLRHAREPLSDAGMDIDERLRERIRVRIGFLIDQELAALEALRDQAVTDGDSTPADWRRFSEIRKACRPLFRECLALIEGTSTRKAGLDRGLCAIADALLDDLSHRSDVAWGRFTILDTGEAFGEMTEIIRLRFPQTTLWDLPVAAHEFGHFLAPRMKRRGSGRSGYPFLERLDKIKEPQRRLFLHEHFADVLATVALGPAWPFTALLLRLDPFQERAEDIRKDPRSRHPPDDDRAQVILATLRALDDRTDGESYSRLAEALTERWLVAREGAGQTTDEQADTARETADDLLGMISETLPADLRFEPTMWQATDPLAVALAEPGRKPAVTDDMSLQLVLNAAWRARERGVESMADVERRTLDLCTRVGERVQPVVGSS